MLRERLFFVLEETKMIDMIIIVKNVNKFFEINIFLVRVF